MDALVWVSLAILAIVVVVAIISALVLRKKCKVEETKEINYQSFFAIGIAFFPLGLVFMILALTSDFPVAVGIPFFAIGIMYLIIGLSNRNKWKRNK